MSLIHLSLYGGKLFLARIPPVLTIPRHIRSVKTDHTLALSVYALWSVYDSAHYLFPVRPPIFAQPIRDETSVQFTFVGKGHTTWIPMFDKSSDTTLHHGARIHMYTVHNESASVYTALCIQLGRHRGECAAQLYLVSVAAFMSLVAAVINGEFFPIEHKQWKFAPPWIVICAGVDWITVFTDHIIVLLSYYAEARWLLTS